MSILLQLLAVTMVVAGIVWAIVKDRRVATEPNTPGRQAETPARLPWAVYGMLAASSGIFLVSVDMALVGLGCVKEPGGSVTAVIGTLLMIVGSFVFVYGMLDKYLIHRGRPAQPALRVRRMMAAFVAGCILLPMVGLLVPALQQQQGPGAGGVPTRVTDREGRYSIEVPATWEENVQLLDQGFGIAVSDTVRNVHVAVPVENKMDLAKPDLRVYADIWSSQFRQLLEDPEMTPWTETRINSFPAVQCEARGILNGVRVGYLLTCVEANEHFCAIQCWTTASQFERCRAELETITNTFRQEPTSH